jgi:hypothetical protein
VRLVWVLDCILIHTKQNSLGDASTCSGAGVYGVIVTNHLVAAAVISLIRRALLVIRRMVMFDVPKHLDW